MKHTEKYLQAKWVTENPKGYDERDVARANSYCEAYLEGYNQALSIANVVGQSEQLVCEHKYQDNVCDWRGVRKCIICGQMEKAN
jgi:hypothetical protein